MDVTVDQHADGQKFDFLPVSFIKTDELKSFEFDSPNQYIKTETQEFSAVCPFSGLPDIGQVIIEYYPASHLCIELKSLKYYFMSFRNVGIYQENVTKRIYDDLISILKLEAGEIKVTTIYNTRGGFDTTCIEGFI